MINPLKELQKEHEKNKQQLDEQTAITETTRLLAEKGQDDYEMLRSMGLHHNVQAAIELKGRQMELHALEQKYGKVFTKEEIKTIACKYALKFRKTETYKGHVDAGLMQKMREFAQDTGVELSNFQLQYNFYILAPAKAFRLIERPKAPKAPQPEPIVFYKINEDHYRMVHQWGNDLSNWRAVMGWKYASESNYFTYWFLLIFAISFLTLNLLTSSPWWTLIPSIVLAVVVGTGRCIVSSSNDQKEFLTWDKTWEDEFKSKP